MVSNKKCYVCDKVGYFIRDYQLNMVWKNKILVTIIKQFNITTKEYPIEVLDKESEPWEEILGILNIKVW